MKHIKDDFMKYSMIHMVVCSGDGSKLLSIELGVTERATISDKEHR